MNDATLEDTPSKLAELLKHPDDLDKLPSLRSEFTRKKAAIDSQLKVGLKDQLEITQNGMSSITEGQKITGESAALPPPPTAQRKPSITPTIGFNE